MNLIIKGRGVYHWSGGKTYSGDWENDCRQGKGTLYQGDADNKRIVFEGDWVNNKKHVR